MKKIITLIFLLAAGGAVFFLGWVQYEVPIGSRGIIRSKTHGIELVKDGKLHWVWYKLIPKNVKISVFTLPVSSVSFDFSGILPSGETYSTLAGLKTDFSYSFSGSMDYRLKAESLPLIAEKENLATQADMDVYLIRLSKEIENHIKALLWTYSDKEKILKEAQETEKIAVLEKAMVSAYPEIEIVNYSVKALRFPDFILYNEVRELYRSYLAAQRTDLRDTIAEMAAENMLNRRRITELSGYGELLSKYPILIKYLAIEKGLNPGND